MRLIPVILCLLVIMEQYRCTELRLGSRLLKVLHLQLYKYPLLLIFLAWIYILSCNNHHNRVEESIWLSSSQQIHQYSVWPVQMISIFYLTNIGKKVRRLKKYQCLGVIIVWDILVTPKSRKDPVLIYGRTETVC
jgi:hypothetical protein